MATTASASYKPIDSSSAGSPTIDTQPTAGSGKKDPLYASVFGSQIGSPSLKPARLDAAGMDTLDEPVMDTLRRDLNNIVEKVKIVLMMKTPPSESLNDCKRDPAFVPPHAFLGELWGPLVMCLGMAISLGAVSTQNVFVFTLVFMLVWLGALLVTANARLLGYRLSFFQNVCLLGYGLFPLVAVAGVNMILPLFWFLKAGLSGIALAWSSLATVRTLTDESMLDRKMLAAYPMVLYYFIFAWLIVVV